jgi:alkylation response protein AidB-like acyl-CoA dehydrogenase
VTFQREVAEWFSVNSPRGWQDEVEKYSRSELLAFNRRWLRLLNTKGFGAPHVPREWGGGGYSAEEQIIIYREWARSRAPSLGGYDINLFHVPGTLLRAGTRAQQEKYLREAIDGVLWCQAFSEPDAGSDLASLRTMAVRDGDYYRINGQKIWSSHAHEAKYGLLLARTDPDAPKHHGISYFILDMSAPGLEIRRIRQANGQAEFCELFLDEVRIPVEDRIGDENEGWTVAQRTLSVERGILALGAIEHINAGVDTLDDLVILQSGDFTGERLMLEGEAVVTDFAARSFAVRSAALDLISMMQLPGSPDVLSSAVKVASTEMLQELTDYASLIEGAGGLVEPHLETQRSPLSGHWLIDWLQSWGRTISAGTNEIQRNIISERLLGLPREARG